MHIRMMQPSTLPRMMQPLLRPPAVSVLMTVPPPERNELVDRLRAETDGIGRAAGLPRDEACDADYDEGPGDVVCDAMDESSPGDVVCDGDECYLMLDTVGDGLVDSVVAVEDTLPFEAFAQKLIVNPAFEFVSIASTITLIVTFAISFGELSPDTRNFADAADLVCSTFFVFEFLARWWAVGLTRRHLFRPLTILDFINVLPILVSPGLPFVPATPLTQGAVASLSGTALAPLAPLRLLRAARILRLRRLLQAEELNRILQTLTGDKDLEVQESTRVGLRLAFSAFSIVLVSAALLWQLERTVNPQLDGFLDSIYFAFSIITTVGLGDIAPATGSGRLVVTLEQIAAVTIIPLELAALSKALLQEGGVLQEGSAPQVTALEQDKKNLLEQLRAKDAQLAAKDVQIAAKDEQIQELIRRSGSGT